MSASLPTISIGYTVGRLTVIRASSQRKAGYKMWVCQCQCGNELLLDTRCLQRGAVRDCGCTTRVKPGQLDLTGRRFGRLVCTEPTDERDSNGSIVWKCVCDCGNVCCVSGKQLRSGYRKSCGCLSHPPRKEFIGKTFHQLTVIDYAGKADGMHQWRCRCACGNETIVGQTRLQSGKTKSCGCLQARVYIDNLKLCEGTSVTVLEAVKRNRHSGNMSGYTGVYWNKQTHKWTAKITFKNKCYYLGSYQLFEDAVKARKTGEQMHDQFLEWYYREYGCKKSHK